MDREVLKEKIRLTGYLDNIKIGMGFTNQYPELLNNLLLLTSELDNGYVVNKSLRARVMFLFNHDLNIDSIRKNGKWLTFSRKDDRFIDKTGDYYRLAWTKIKNNISNDFFNKEDTINLLLNDNYYLTLFGKAKNRTLIKENPKLYNSIYHHTIFMNDFNINNNKFSCRIITLVKYKGDVNAIRCYGCKKCLTSFNYKIMDFNKLCYTCFNNENENKYPNKVWFKEKYGNEWVLEYDRFIERNNLVLVSDKGYSKISQKIFWLIYNKLDECKQKECYFKELNNEWYISHKKNFFYVDFKCGNKIIEFDGIYWHRNSKEKDERRDCIYHELGYDILVINEDDLVNKKDKIGDELINKCVQFITNGN